MRKHVLKCMALVFLIMLPAMLHAQSNPKPGFVITNDNDTIYGTIDYLSDTKNAYECRFKPDNETQYKVYKPGDISAYRFTNDGIFYVTKTFTVDDQPKTFFAEYLLQGGVNLFHYKEAGTDYYFFIDQDGKVASVKDVGMVQHYTGQAEVNKDKRAALREVSQFFSESSKAQHDLWIKDINADNLTKIAYDYNMEYCRDAGECVQFRYSEKASRSMIAKLRLQAAAGMGIAKLKCLPEAYIGDEVTMKAVVPQIGVGMDLLFPRSGMHWSLQALGLVSKWSKSKDVVDDISFDPIKTVKLSFWDLEIQVGAAYSLSPSSKISPIVRGGMVINQPLGLSTKRFYSTRVINDENTIWPAVGFYFGAGTDITLGSHQLRLAAEYKWAKANQWTNSAFSALTLNYLAISAGICL